MADPKNEPAKPRKTATLKSCIVTGGSGFLGSALAKGLLEKGCTVKILDVTPPDFKHDNLSYAKCDISNFDDLEKHFAGVDTVFHAAAIIDLRGGSGTTAAARNRSHGVNVQGGRNVLKAAAKHGVKRVVATSSNNATLNRGPNPDMSSSTPLATDIFDLYTETKVIIEPEILGFSGKQGVLTGIIRPSGIYGPGNNYMMVQLLENMAAGRLVANMGTPQAVHDASFVDNLVTGHIGLAENLVEGSPCCGKAYFIVDDEKMNQFEFFRPVIEACGYKFPKIWIPSIMVRPFMVLWQWLHWKIKLPRPMLTPKEVDKVCVTHFSNTRDAYEDFGWRPVGTYDEYMEAIIPWCQDKLKEIKARKK